MIRRLILFHNKRHPDDMGKKEIEDFLTYLAVNRKVAASTQSQALSAILFLYQKVHDHKLDWLDNVVRAKRLQRLPVVLGRQEAKQLINHIQGVNGLIARLLYGTGMRQMECLRLRVKDIDFHYRQITIRSGKGDKDRVTILHETLVEPLLLQLQHSKERHLSDLMQGYGEASLPYALDPSTRMLRGRCENHPDIHSCSEQGWPRGTRWITPDLVALARQSMHANREHRQFCSTGTCVATSYDI